MKNLKKSLSKLSALLMVAVLICAMLPVQADAVARRDVPVLCAVLDSNGDITDIQPGIPVASGDGTYMLTDDEFYQGDYTYITIFHEDDVVEMEFQGSVDGIALFSFTYSDKSVCVPEGQCAVGETVSLQMYNTDGELVFVDTVITGYSSTTTEAGFVPITADMQGSIGDANVYLPGALLNDSGALVAFLIDEGAFALVEPTGSSADNGGSNGGSDGDSENGGGSGAPSRNPSEAPTEAPAETDAATVPGPETEATTPGGKDDNGGNDDNGGDSPMKKYMIPIVGAVALIVLAIVAVLVLRKPKPAPYQPPIPPQPPVPPVPPAWNPDGGGVTQPGPGATAPIPGITGWEPEPPVPVSTGMCLLDSSGTLGGRTFGIGAAGALIGRAANADVQYPPDTKGVSRNHCRVYWEGGRLMLVDNGSTSGTYVLGKGQLRTGTPTEIRHGDVICLGSKKISLTVMKR